MIQPATRTDAHHLALCIVFLVTATDVLGQFNRRCRAVAPTLAVRDHPQRNR